MGFRFKKKDIRTVNLLIGDLAVALVSAPDIAWTRRIFPLAALAGQAKLKLALLLLAVAPNLGGVLLVGEKGTAKSTAVRALAELLPPLDVVRGCPYNCDPSRPADLCPSCLENSKKAGLPAEIRPTPFLTLPLGATEDRVAGGLDIEASIKSGRARLRPGLLGQANRGFLYIDEVNLLEPYLAHLLVDAVESGRLHVEREGLSLWHPAQAALIGTMNPEEGPLGPQLADRFALTVPVKAEEDPELRSEIVRRRLAFEANPANFRNKWADETKSLADRIVNSRRRLAQVTLTAEARQAISRTVKKQRLLGHRADLALARASLALAAWEDSSEAGPDQVAKVAELVLAGRKVKEKLVRPTRVQILQDQAPAKDRHFEKPLIQSSDKTPPPSGSGGEGVDGEPLTYRLYSPNEAFEIITPNGKRDQGLKNGSGRRTARQTQAAAGRYFRSSAERLGRPVALDATLRAAAPHQVSRRRDHGPSLVVKNQDVREKVFRRKTGRLILFLVDASGSVGSFDRMSEAKAAALALLGEAYLKRDRVGLIAFHGDEAKVLLPPTSSVDMAGRRLRELPTGGKTPLAAGLVATHRVIRIELARDPQLTPLIVLMTDGRPNIPLTPGNDPWREVLALAGRMAADRRLKFLLVDTDRGHYADYKLTRDLAENLRAPRLTLEDLRQGKLEAWLEATD